jgi:hypothetical protein
MSDQATPRPKLPARLLIIDGIGTVLAGPGSQACGPTFRDVSLLADRSVAGVIAAVGLHWSLFHRSDLPMAEDGARCATASASRLNLVSSDPAQTR